MTRNSLQRGGAGVVILIIVIILIIAGALFYANQQGADVEGDVEDGASAAEAVDGSDVLDENTDEEVDAAADEDAADDEAGAEE